MQTSGHRVTTVSNGAREQGDYDGYIRLSDELKRRLAAPRKHPTYLAFFIGSFVMFAAFGVWLEVVKLALGLGEAPASTAGLRTAIATYFPAILGSVAMQLAISETLRSLRAWGQIINYAFLFLALILVIANNLLDWAAIGIGIVASVLALLWWWIVNADARELRDDEPPPEVAVGGVDPSAPLLGGDTLNQFEA